MLQKKICALLLSLMLLLTASAGAEFMLPADLTIIAEEAFYGDTSLTGTVEIPEGVIEIGARAFGGCTNIQQIILPPSVVEIAQEAFQGCENAEFVVYEGSYAHTWCNEMGIVPTLQPTEEKGDIRIWVPAVMVDIVSEKVAEFAAEYDDAYAGYSLTVEEMNEMDAVTHLLTDLDASADLFIISQDHLERLAKIGALSEVPECGNAGSVARAGAVVNGKSYGFPLTMDNGYFMYYDKSVITDPTSLEQIIADCEAAGKTVNYEVNSGWYVAAFFFGAGCKLEYTVGTNGHVVDSDITIASAQGVKALRSIINLVHSPAFRNNSSAFNVEDQNLGVIVDGVWDENAIREILGDNYAAAKMPKTNGMQLKCFSGGKYIGVKPQENRERQALITELAAYLSCADMQRMYYEHARWLPADRDIHSNVASAAERALVSQVTEASVLQRPYPGEYWSVMTAFIDKAIAGELNDCTDAELLKELEYIQYMLASYVVN